MNRKKLFLENIFAYGFIRIINKIVPFFLLPLITRMLPDTSDYGVYNMYNTIIGFGTPLAILGLYDAMFREYFERDDIKYKFDVVTTAQRVILLSSIIIGALLILLNRHISIVFFGEGRYGNIIILAGIAIFLGANRSPIQAPTRMNNQKKVFIISGLVSSIVMYGLSLLFIYKGLSYLGLIYANIITVFIMVLFFYKRNKKYFLQGSFNINIAKELLKIGLPLLPSFFIYWIYNSMDKIMIANMLGTKELGIYSIGSKIAQVSQLIYAGFAGGWQFFSFSTMKDKDQIQLNSKVFEYLSVISTLSLIFIYPFIYYLFLLLFEGDYIKGYIVAPYLYLSPLLLMLFQVIANQFLIIKKSKYITFSLIVGAILNVYMNYILIKYIGIEGASIATLLGYYITIITIMIISIKNNLMRYKKRTLIILFINPVYLSLQKIISSNFIFQFGLMVAFVIIIMILYRAQLFKIVSSFKNKINLKKR